MAEFSTVYLLAKAVVHWNEVSSLRMLCRLLAYRGELQLHVSTIVAAGFAPCARSLR
jgi:hypothetical protein